MLIPTAGMIILVAYVRVVRLRNLIAVVEGFIDLRAFKRYIREESLYAGWASNALLLNSWLVISLFVTYSLMKYLPNSGKLNAQEVWWSILLFFFLYYWLKRVIVFLLGTVTEVTQVVIEYTAYNKFYIKFLGIVLLPLFVMLNFLSYDLTLPAFYYIHYVLPYVIAIVILIGYLTKVYQGYQQCVEIKVSGYYLFLYFCTLEILPLIGVFYWLIGDNSFLN
jgi:hypothetical protein